MPKVRLLEVKTLKTMLKNTTGKEDNSPTPIDYDHVKLILDESEKYGVKHEVEQTAKVYMERDGMLFVDAYHHAFHDWVK
jgi:ATP-dependent protease HslVU (ClpYQ) ATPase subunit